MMSVDLEKTCGHHSGFCCRVSLLAPQMSFVGNSAFLLSFLVNFSYLLSELKKISSLCPFKKNNTWKLA